LSYGIERHPFDLVQLPSGAGTYVLAAEFDILMYFLALSESQAIPLLVQGTAEIVVPFVTFWTQEVDVEQFGEKLGIPLLTFS